MSMTMTAAPAAEPVTLDEAKAHLRVDGDGENAFISSLIVTSRLQIEAALGLALVTQSWRLTLDDWPADFTIELPMRPVQTVDSIEVCTSGDTDLALAPSMYVLDGNAAPARIVFEAPLPAPCRAAAGITIDFTAGFGGPSSVPQNIKHALLLLVAHWFENREPQEHEKSAAVPAAISALLAPYRVVRL